VAVGVDVPEAHPATTTAGTSNINALIISWLTRFITIIAYNFND
jgi:hypothetical protein